MKLINQSFEIIEQPNTTIGLFKHIEKACRICYKSEDKITDTSYQRFLTMIRSNGHLSPWEHGTVYMKINAKENKADFDLFYLLLNNKPWVRMSYDNNENWYITTNYRAIIENKLENLWEKYRCSFTGEHTPRITVKFITSIGISRELNRHRCHSICEESTRYCVSGDTLLKYKNSHAHYTIKELWEDKQNKNRLSKILIEVLNTDTGILEYSKIKNIFNNGIKKVYKITTELGYSLKCTIDHQIYTPDGWKHLSELNIGDKIYVNGIDGPVYQNKDWLEYHYLKSNKTVSEICKEFGFKPDVIRKWLYKYNIIKPILGKQLYQDFDRLYNQNITLNKTFVAIGNEFNFNVSTLKKWAKKLGIPNKGTGYFNIGRIPWNKEKNEFEDERVAKQANALRNYHHNGDSTEKILKENTSKYQKHKKPFCEICKTTIDLEVHHKDKNHSNNIPDNLMTVCHSCHQKIHNQSLTSLHGDRIITITELDEEEEVFDLEIENYHNYVANGIIVHNCNYSKDKFNNELTFIKPVNMDIKVGDYDMQLFSNQSYFTDYNPTDVFILSLLQSEESYLQLIKEGFKPQQARDVLPLATKTEVIHTAFIDDWIHFFELRCSNAAHPQIRELANNLKQEFIKRGYIHE